jgi:preprotein translocase subunit SecA
MRVFASDVIKRVMGTFKIPEDEPIYNSMITRALEKAQTRIEEINFDSRKHVLSYDDVLNIQRQSIYSRRRTLLIGGDSAVDEELARIAEAETVQFEINAEGEQVEVKTEPFSAIIERKKKEFGESFHMSVRRFLLQTIDYLWVENLEAMEYLRSSVNLRAYGQRDPLVEYKKEGLKLFQSMEDTYAANVKNILPNITLAGAPVARESQVIHKAAAAITVGSGNGPKKEYGRNDHVIITNGTQQQEMKYKKAESLLATGEWKIVQK